MTFDEYLEQLVGGGDPLAHSSHTHLSGLTDDELADLESAWSELPPARGLVLLDMLIELADDNVDLDFTRVFKMCLGDTDEGVRRSALRGLWECHDRALIRPLTALLATDPSASVRAAAATALSPFSERARDGKLIRRDSARVREALMTAVENPDEEPEVTRRAVEAVGHFAGTDIDDAVQRTHRADDPLLRQSALHAMGSSSHLRWLDTLTAELDNEDAAMRYEAAGALGRLGERSKTVDLVTLLEDEDSQVRLAAATALGSLGGRLAKEALLKCTEIGDEPLEQAARAALEEVDFEGDPLGVQSKA